MPDPRWTGPPEVVAAIFEAGSPASVLANNIVWVTETANDELAQGISAANTLATAAQWDGVGSVASTVAATGLNAGLQTLVGWTAEKIAVTQAAVEAFALARSSAIPSVVSQTNRDEWTVLNATNFFGQNTPGIVERDGEYFGEHWPHNSGIGWTYSATLTALIAALAVPPPIAPMGASPAASATAAQAVAEAAAQTGMQASTQVAQTAGQATAAPADASNQLSSLMQQPLQMISGATEPLQQFLQAPMQAMQGISGLPQGMMQAFGGMFPAAEAPTGAGIAAEPVVAAGGIVGGASAGGGLGGAGGFPGAGLTSYTRPTSSFEPEPGGRPTSPRAGVLNAAEVRGPTVSSGMGGSPVPMTPAGMLARGNDTQKEDVVRARVVVDGRS